MRIAPVFLLIACQDDPTADSADSGTVAPSPCEAASLPLPGDGLFPEGAAVDASGRVFAGTLGTGQIFAAPDCTAAPFASLDAGRSVVGMAYDDARGVLLACDSSLDGTAPVLAVFDGATGERVASHPLATGFGLCNDLAVAPDGTVYVSESYVSVVLALAPDDVLTDGAPASVWLQDEALAATPGAFGLNGIALVGADLYLTHSEHGDLIRVPIAEDGSAGAPVALTLSADLAPDGLRALPDGRLLAIDAGVAGVVAVQIAGDAATLTPVATGLDMPTSVAPTPDGGAAWVVESQFDHLFGYDTSPPDPFQLVRIDVP